MGSNWPEEYNFFSKGTTVFVLTNTPGAEKLWWEGDVQWKVKIIYEKSRVSFPFREQYN